MVWGCNLDGSRKVENDLVQMIRPSSTPCPFDSVTQFDRKLGFCLRKRFWAVLVPELCTVFSRALISQFANDLGVLDGELEGLLFGVLEDDVTKQRARGVVHVDDSMFAARDCVDRPLDQVFAGRCKDLAALSSTGLVRLHATHLDPDVVRDLVLLDESAYEAELCVAGRRICDLDFLEATLEEQLEEGRLLLDRHRIGQGLVTVTKVRRKPDGGLSPECFRWPLPVVEFKGGVRLVLLRGVKTR